MGKLKWTYEACKEEALKYTTRNQYSKNSASSYNSAREHKWLNDICSHMNYEQLPKNYWTKEICQLESLKYSSKVDFKLNSPTAYSTARKRKWFNEICSHMEVTRKPNGYWTKDRCKEEALKYTNCTDFQKSCSSAYNTSLKNQWYCEITSHFELKGNWYKRFIYAYEFIDGSVYVGLTYNIEERRISHNISGSVFEYITKTGYTFNFVQITPEPVDVEDAKKLEAYYLDKYIKEGWKPLNKNKAGGVGGNSLKWTIENLRTEALKYNYRGEFTTKSPSAYNAALKRGLLDSICSHMTRKHKEKAVYSLEKCIEISCRYTNMRDFVKAEPAAYHAVLKNKWQEFLCETLIRKRNVKNYWDYDKCIEISKDFKSFTELRNKHYGAYKLILKMGWQERIKNKFKND